MPNESEPKGWWHTLPGILTATAAVLTAITGLIVAIRSIEQSRTPALAPRPAQTAPAPVPGQGLEADQARTQPSIEPTPKQTPPAAVPRQKLAANPVRPQPSAVQPPTSGQLEQEVRAGISLTGTWQDNFGNVTKFLQHGASIRFEGYGKSCTGGNYQSRGSGSISGNQIRSTYQSTMPSTGNCVGHINELGTSISSTCTDSMCGTFVTSATKMQ